MKINLPYHTVETRTKDSFTYTDDNGQQIVDISDKNWRQLAIKEIPLAYINTDNVKYEPDIDIEDDFLKESSRFIRPYDAFEEDDPYFFDKDKKAVSGKMKEINSLYYYEPAKSTEFSPLTFNTYLEIKKNQDYFNDINYDIKVAVMDSTQDMSFADTLISIFGDKYIWGDCPPNMRINGGAKTAVSLISQDIASADFVFVQSKDGVHLGSSTFEEIEIDEYLEDHTNVWISVSGNYNNRFKTNVATRFSTTLNYEPAVLFVDNTYTIKTDILRVFDQDVEFVEDQFGNPPDIEYPCEAVLIMHKQNKGFVIVSPSWFLEERLEETHKMVYEIMMRIYLSSYVKSNTSAVWITDQPVDFLAYHEQRYGLRHNMISIKELLPDYDDTTMTIKKVMVTSPYVTCIGFSDSGNILFKKTEDATEDPVKPEGFLSFYTTKHSVIYYEPENLLLLEEPIEIECVSQDNSMLVVVKPYNSSSNRVQTKTDQFFEISELFKAYILYVSKETQGIENSFILLEESIEPEDGYVKVARIQFSEQEEPIVCDTRILGGGLPDAQSDDYDMLDIGHIFGRPLRLGSTLIISLPMKLNPYKERIKKELDKHIAAGDDYSLIFLQGEEE